MGLGPVLAEQLHYTRDWTQRLLADFGEGDWGFQPAPGLAHALWLCGHLAVSQNVLIHQRCLGTSVVDDAFAKHFQIGGPVAGTSERPYPRVDDVRGVMEETHQKTLVAIRGMSDAALAEPAFGANGSIHPHYRDKLGAVSHCSRHEAFHAGQLAMIRRLRGKSFLR
ncbi:DinB superfamily protein [Phycisphaerae bacterium RAS1]|nr:DinB superfamily protein [Phycisphaerae bacterium RAS1]